MPLAGKPKLLDHVRDVMRRKQLPGANPRAAFLVWSITLFFLVEFLESRLFSWSEMKSGLA